MFALPLVASLFATLSLVSLARPGSRTPLYPWNGVPDANNFTLLAVFKADNDVQKPLVLGSTIEPSVSPLAWIGSAESIKSIIARNFVMVDGGVTAYYGPDDSIVGVSKYVPKENGWLSFFRPHDGTTVSPAKVYCTLFNTSPHGVEYPYALAVNGGDSDDFYLCQRTDGDEFVVIYGAVESNSTDAGYKYGTCSEVAIHVLPVGQQ